MFMNKKNADFQPQDLTAIPQTIIKLDYTQRWALHNRMMVLLREESEVHEAVVITASINRAMIFKNENIRIVAFEFLL